MGKVFGGLLAMMATLIAVILLFVLVQYLRAGAAAPDYAAADTVPSLSGEVRILRDDHGVPHIFGDSDLDVFRGLGYAHARDRLWQMDLQRRATRGTVSELMGAVALKGDRRVRALGVPDNVARSWAAMPKRTRAVLNAYADGVNAYLASDHFVLPAEYRLILAEPEAWEPVDAIFVFKNLWMTLSAGGGTELGRLRRAQTADQDFADFYYAPYPDDGDIALDWADVAAATGLEARTKAPDGAADAVPLLETGKGGSNNWVLAGKLTKSGKPLLANDPHLGLTMPSIWYLAHLALEGGPLVGVTIPGMPLAPMGRTSTIAWGLTNNPNDAQDYLIATIDPDNPDNYLTPTGSAPFERREECFDVRFSGRECVTMLRTSEGPVVPLDLLNPDLDFDESKQRLVSVWTGEREPDVTLDSLLQLNRGRELDAALDGFRTATGPLQNIVYAHASGDIGYVSPGLVPIRAEGHPTNGRTPAPLEDPAARWTGYIPPEYQPQVRNPASGRIATANARVMPDEYSYYLGDRYAPDSRQRRIKTMIDAQGGHDIASMRAIQLDATAPAAVEILPLLIDTEAAGEAERVALRALEDWRGDYAADSPAPLIYQAWTMRLNDRILSDDMDDETAGRKHFGNARLLPVLRGEEARWCDIRNTDAVESCAELKAETLTETVAALKTAYGPMTDWRWRDAFVEDHGHLGFGPIPVIGKWLSRTTVRDAGPDAPNVAAIEDLGEGIYGGAGWAASMRMIADFSDLERTKFVISSGQSGFFGSDQYDDQQKLWAAGKYIEIPTDPSRLESVQETVLSP
ncbi:MAG: penicillin acylase family protein [Pacificimonas sp.]